MAPQVKDRSLPMSQGYLTDGGNGVSGLKTLINSEEYHTPSGHESAPGTIYSGPQAEGASAYKTEGSQPVVARMSGHAVQQTGSGVTARLDKSGVKTAKPADGPVTSTPDQLRHSGTSFKR